MHFRCQPVNETCPVLLPHLHLLIFHLTPPGLVGWTFPPNQKRSQRTWTPPPASTSKWQGLYCWWFRNSDQEKPPGMKRKNVVNHGMNYLYIYININIYIYININIYIYININIYIYISIYKYIYIYISLGDRRISGCHELYHEGHRLGRSPTARSTFALSYWPVNVAICPHLPRKRRDPRACQKC